MFFLHLLIFTILPSFSTGVYTYGIIRNASIQLPFALPKNLSHQLPVDNCTDCLCEAYRHGEKVYLFTCTEIAPKFLCEFYYFMPKRDEIVYPRNDSTIYLIKNETFEEKADCCNTTYLVEQIRNTSSGNPLISNNSRFLVFGDDHTILAILDNKIMRGFNRSNMDTIDSLTFNASSSTIGYCDGKYYFSQNQKDIQVYNRALSFLYNITLGMGDLTAIRFLNATQMLVAVEGTNASVYIFEKPNATDQFESSKKIPGTDGGQTHAIGIVNENAFYVGWYSKINTIALFMRDGNNSWYRNDSFNISHNVFTSDIFVDQCQRIWAVHPDESQLFIFDRNGRSFETVPRKNGSFGVLILEEQNYTLITSSSGGIYRTHPPYVNYLISFEMNSCDPSYLSATFDYPIENNDWRPKQDLLLIRFGEVKYSETFRTINQDYGSFYHQPSPPTCTPDILREKVSKRHEQYLDCLLEQAPCYPWKNYWQTNVYPQCHTQTITITHRKKFSSCNDNDMTIEFLVGQIRQRLKGSIDSNNADALIKSARILVTEYLIQQPSASVADVINGVIEKLK